MKYSFIVMDPPTRDTFATLQDCGYDGIELNMREPFDLDSVERNLEDHNLVMPSFLTGEAYFDGLCLSSPRAEVRRQTVERLIRYVDIAHRFKSIMVVGLLQGLRRDELSRTSAGARAAGVQAAGARAARARAARAERAAAATARAEGRVAAASAAVARAR
jgi:sugar phosphate isomerase/epimerase